MYLMLVPQPKSGPFSITPYKGGGTQAKGLKPLAKLSSNENPLGASPLAVKAYQEAVNSLHRYPQASAADLKQAIADVYGLNPANIICGAGSDEIISLLCVAYAGEGDEVLYSQYGFLMYSISAQAAGATPVMADEENYTTHVDNLLAKATDNTKIVFVANPNNPTGTYLSHDEVVRLRNGLPEHTLLVLDGAYAEYVDLPDYSNGKTLVDHTHNTVMTHTFSKIYGLAALRVGWAYAPDNVVDIFERVRGPFNVSAPALAAASAAVKDKAYTLAVKQHNDKWLPKFTDHIRQLGLEVTPSVGNFVLVHFSDHTQAGAADAYLKEQDVIVRDMKAYGLSHALRISIGTDEDNERLLEALREFMQR